MQIHTFRCFGERADEGNPALVIEDEPSLPDARQASTREHNMTCVWIDPSGEPGVAGVVDYFYPHTRSPLCLHATLAVAQRLFMRHGLAGELTVKTAVRGQRLGLVAGANGEVILGNVSAFKQHCSFGLWGAEIAQRLRADGAASSEGMGTFGKITSLDDLPSRSKMVSYVEEAAKQIATGERTKAWSRPRVAKAEPEIPAELAEALSKNKAAAKLFAAKGPGCRREYCAWIAGAKREETRAKRVAQAVTWIAEGKLLNWKYEKAS